MDNEIDVLELLASQNALLQGIRSELRALRLTMKETLTGEEADALTAAEKEADAVAELFIYEDEPQAARGMA